MRGNESGVQEWIAAGEACQSVACVNRVDLCRRGRPAKASRVA
jgi:hypothetical protein